MAALPPERFYRGVLACDLAWGFGLRTGALIGAIDGYDEASASASGTLKRLEQWVKPKGEDERAQLRTGLLASVARGALLGSFLCVAVDDSTDWPPDPWDEVRRDLGGES